MNTQQANNYAPVNHMPVYSGRGRPPKFTSVNNRIVVNPLYSNIPQASQPQQFVPNDNDIQVQPSTKYHSI